MKVNVKRIDHLGIVAGTIKDLGIVELIDGIIKSDSQEEITSGEAVAGMILNGLGFVSRPLMLTPQFFEGKPLEILIRKGIQPEHFNRHKLGRVLDDIGEYGCEKLFNTIALEACRKEKIDMRFAHADTTSYSLNGEYDSDSDTEKINVTYGYSKDKRQDLKQVVQELITSQDGGIPFITKAWDGNASDTIILRERVDQLMEEFSKAGDRIFVSDSKLFDAKTAKILDKIKFLTRVPSTIGEENKLIDKALQSQESWTEADSKGYKLQEFSVDLYGISDQRWIVVNSKQARERAQETLTKMVTKEKELIDKQLSQLQTELFSCETDAQKQLTKISKKWKFHQATNQKTTTIKHYTKRGRPTANTPYEIKWQIQAQALLNQVSIDKIIDQRSCFVLATNVCSDKLPIQEVLPNYKGQDKTEKGFMFLKSPEFFASSFFVKKASRIDGLLMIMVLSLLVYSIAQRRIRNQLNILKLMIPNQINKPTATPTMRWIFQIFEGINYVTVELKGAVNHIIEGLTELRTKIIKLMSPNVQQIYQIFETGG